MNRHNYEKVLAQIEADPTCWNQSSWHCGTQHCFFGWAQILSGKEASGSTVRRDARIYLDLSWADANYLSDPLRSLAEIKEFLEDDRAGYNRAGYDRDGYNRAGYNRAGYDRDGLDVNNKPRGAITQDAPTGYEPDGTPILKYICVLVPSFCAILYTAVAGILDARCPGRDADMKYICVLVCVLVPAFCAILYTAVAGILDARCRVRRLERMLDLTSDDPRQND
jgi:hypothetical protein